ncbi:MAG TPA: FG-GAP-like repeat-containing protein [bacterium]|nr:FG-GAP-like repeat-containing protein [bacterium]HQG46128.1 FG-GAP-like repeat-containing protein [bacterium]HQI47946.1 FG-GAP-like repeat-containing protein [bacterium]HQJ64623.1 FG-GAP-like repeat-containing protein [bacterium]
MRSRTVTMLLMCVVALLFVSSGSLAQGPFVRGTEIPVPETDLNNGGTGNFIAGVDLDKDGKTEIYLVNDNWNDTATEVIPRIYKLEKQGSEWVVVWKAVGPVLRQNTWPCLAVGDLDKDGKQEIIWGVVNNTGDDNLNPYRILVYESKGDGSDVMGVDDGVGGYLPNAKWTITAENKANIRPMRWVIADPDKDGNDEIVFADRTGKSGSGYFFGVIGVDKIPDNGDGSEVWSLKTSGLDFNLKSGTTQNKWDVAVLGSNIYTFCEIEITKVSWDGFGWSYSKLAPMAGGSPVQSAQVVDLDGNGTQEIVCAVYDWGNDAYKGIYLLQEEADTLKRTELFNMSAYWPGGSRGPWGSACGDIDRDGKMDFVFGSRAGTPNASIYNMSYRGGDITNPASYTFARIDSMYAEGGIWTNLAIANVDDDPQLEVLYTSSTDAGVFPDLGTKPIVVLDYQGSSAPVFDNLVVATEVLLNGAAPGDGIRFKPGSILDNGKIIWFCAENINDEVSWVWRSIDGGKTFTHNATAIPSMTSGMVGFDANTAVTVQSDGKIWRTTDGGANWTEVYSYTISPIAPGWFDGVSLMGESSAIAFGDMEPDGSMHFVRTDDKGATWNEIFGIDYMQAAYAFYRWGLAGCTVGQNMWVCAEPTNYVGSFVFRTRDGGSTWDSFAIPASIIPTYPRAIAFSSADNGLIADRRGNVVASVDGGATWYPTNKADTSADSWVNGVQNIPGTNIILGYDDLGVYATTDLGATWSKLNTPAEVVPIDNYYFSGLFLNKDFGYVFAYPGIVLRFANQLTGVTDRPIESQPEAFQLAQNYPNPFNPTTTISYTLPARQNVSLAIYNLKGELVKTLADGVMSEGAHTVQWDATNEFGQKVTSGIYLYLLRSNGQQIARQMVLIK